MAKKEFDRPFLTFEEQIYKLTNDYKLIINDDDFAKEALSSFSYYDLINGYQQIYKKDKEYIEGTTIELLCTMHIFNKNIQGVLFKYATYVENTFKTILSHVVAESFTEDENEYLNIKNYVYDHNPDKRRKLRAIITNMKITCAEEYRDPTKHYRNNRNHIPPWILFRNISFSDATDLFIFLKREQKETLLSHIDYVNVDSLGYSDKINIVGNALNLIRKFRNKIAHNLDFLVYRGSPLNKKANILFKDSLVLQNEMKITRNDVWAMVLSIIILLNNKFLVQNLLGEFNSFMTLDDNLSEAYCNMAGIPIDFEERISNFRDSFTI